MNSSVGEIIRKVVLTKSAASFNSNSIENIKVENIISDLKKQRISRQDDNSRKEATETLSYIKCEDLQDVKPHLRTGIAGRKRYFESRQDDKNSRKKATKTSPKKKRKNVQDDKLHSRTDIEDQRKKWEAKTPEERREIKRLRNRTKRHRKTMEKQNNLQKEIAPETQNATETDIEKKQDDDKPCKTVTAADLERRRLKKRMKNRIQRKKKLRRKYNSPIEISLVTQKATEADLEIQLENVLDDKPNQKLTGTNLERMLMKGQNDKLCQKATESDLEQDQENAKDDPRRKATKADLERKREKSRLNRKLKRAKRVNKKLSPESRKFAIDYLNLWHSSRSQWAFKTKQQHWLLRHIFDPNNISEEEFAILLQYIISLRGIAKSRLIEQSEKIISMEEEKFMFCSDEITKSTEEANDTTISTEEANDTTMSTEEVNDTTMSTEEANDTTMSTEEANDVNSTIVERARQVLQTLV